MNETIETWTVCVDGDTDELERQLAAAATHGKQFGRALSTAFQGVALEGKSVGDVLRNMTLSLSKMALQSAFKPLEQTFGSIFQNLISGGGGGLFGGAAFANGGVIDRGMPVPFAAGGVISSPISFPMKSGAMGIAGERGAEAIMPLARGSDGRLGVKTNGGGGGVSVTFNVSTPDVDGFRRTQTQIAAMLARTVGQGQRNL